VRNDRCWNNSLSECAYPPCNSCNFLLYCYFFILFYVFILKRNICVIGHLIFGKRRTFPASRKLPFSCSHNITCDKSFALKIVFSIVAILYIAFCDSKKLSNELFIAQQGQVTMAPNNFNELNQNSRLSMTQL